MSNCSLICNFFLFFVCTWSWQWACVSANYLVSVWQYCRSATVTKCFTPEMFDKLQLTPMNLCDSLSCSVNHHPINTELDATQGCSQDFYCGGGVGLKPPRCRDQFSPRCLGGRVYGAGVPLPSGVRSGEGAVLHPQKIFEVFCVQ